MKEKTFMELIDEMYRCDVINEYAFTHLIGKHQEALRKQRKEIINDTQYFMKGVQLTRTQEIRYKRVLEKWRCSDGKCINSL